MKNEAFKYPANRFGGYLPDRIPEPSDTRFYNDAVIHGFNDFMTQCRHSSVIRIPAPPLKRIRDEPDSQRFADADIHVTDSVSEQENNSSTIKTNRTMSNETFVAFATQKGGIGKSTVTALAANYLHNVKGHNVAVIDCDTPQHSIHGLRERETGLIGGGRDFTDNPRDLKSNGVVKTLSQMDYIFAPMSADRFVVESTLQFAVMFRDNLMTTGQAKTKGLYLFWTMVDGREKNGLYDLYEDVIAEMGLPVLSTRLPDSKKFRRDLSEERKSVFRSTIFPMDASLLKGSGIREFSEEISRIIRPQ